jgi:myo-inositol-1-phosphate synthase
VPEPIRVAIVGVGNCASALLQGLAWYRERGATDRAGLMAERIGDYSTDDIQLVAAFDVDARKVGRPLEAAVFAPPNCARVFQADLPDSGVIVEMGPVLDGVAPHMESEPAERRFVVCDAEPVDVAAALREARVQVLVCYLPVGSERAVRHYARACLEAGVALVNCVPVLVASDPELGPAFAAVGLPLIGDDIKSQFGATLLHRVLAHALCERGATVARSYQLNTGGNTDFLNMLDRSRLATKRRSKTEAVQSQLGHRLPAEQLHIGPSDYVPWQQDNKVAFLRLEWEGFGGTPMHLEARLSVEDSPNSAGVVVDAIRVVRVALDRGIGGPLEAASAWYMKHPPRQMSDDDAKRALERFLVGD